MLALDLISGVGGSHMLSRVRNRGPLELCQESSMVNHVSQQWGRIHQTWPCLLFLGTK